MGKSKITGSRSTPSIMLDSLEVAVYEMRLLVKRSYGFSNLVVDPGRMVQRGLPQQGAGLPFLPINSISSTFPSTFNGTGTRTPASCACCRFLNSFNAQRLTSDLVSLLVFLNLSSPCMYIILPLTNSGCGQEDLNRHQLSSATDPPVKPRFFARAYYAIDV